MDKNLKFSEKYKNIGDIEIAPDQIDGINFLLSHENGILAFQTGTGKCFAKGTKILMYDGTIKEVQDIRTGEKIMGWDSKARAVTSLAHGYENMYEVQQKSKESYIVNESHILSLKVMGLNKRITVIDNKGNRYHTGEIINIPVSDYLKCTDTFKRNVKGFQKEVRFKEQNVPIDPYLLGLWIGDGAKDNTRIYTMDDEVRNYLREYADANGMYYSDSLKCGKYGDCYMCNVRINKTKKTKNKNPFLTYIKNEFVEDKHIPDIYKINSKEIRLQILAGLLDTDGYLNGSDHRSFEFTTKYKRLNDDITFLARSLGLRATSTVKHNKKYNKDYYRCGIYGNVEIIPVKVKRRVTAENHRNKNSLSYGIELKSLGMGEYFGFTLEGKDRMFLLADFTVVHNTMTSLVTMKIVLDNIPDAKGIVVMPVKALKAFKKEIFNRIGYSENEVGILATNETHADFDNNKVLLITYTNIDKYIDNIKKQKEKGTEYVLIIDEAHSLQDKKAKFYKSMAKVKKQVSMCWGLTATPILNNLDSLYYITNFFVPKFLGDKWTFDNRYTNFNTKTIKKKITTKDGRQIIKDLEIREVDSYKNLEELNTKLKDIMIIRSKEYNLKFANISRQLSDLEYSIYDKVSTGFLSTNFQKNEERNFSKRLHDLQRFVDRAFDSDTEMQELVYRYNSNSQYSTKEKMLLKTLKSTLDKGYSTIIYADYTETVKRLHNILEEIKDKLGINNIFEITGQINIKLREQVEEEIGDKDVILITSAGSESINLQKANCVILYDIPFSVKTTIQVVGRVCRRDTKHPYQYIIIMYTKGTIDEYKYMIFQSNLGMVQKSVKVANDLPLELLDVDKKELKELRKKLLWSYKSGTLRNRLYLKELIRRSISVSELKSDKYIVAKYKFIVEPINADLSIQKQLGVKETESLYPNEQLFYKYMQGEIDYSVIKTDYLEYLRSEKGRRLIASIHQNVLNKGSLLLIGNTDIPNILREEILGQFLIAK